MVVKKQRDRSSVVKSLQYLSVAVEGGVVQGSSSASVRYVDATQQRDDDLGTSQGIIGCGDMKRRLPVLVPSVHVSRVANQNSHSLLREKSQIICLTVRIQRNNLYSIGGYSWPHLEPADAIFT